MIAKEFPDIVVDIKHDGSDLPFYVGSLGVPVAGVSVPLAYALAAGIKNSQKFLGGTMHDTKTSGEYLTKIVVALVGNRLIKILPFPIKILPRFCIGVSNFPIIKYSA